MDSNATEDRCGICHGDGTQCVTIRGLYDKNEGLGYKEVVVIPEGSRNIKVEELGNSKNYIGIGRPKTNEYFLNGKRYVYYTLVIFLHYSSSSITKRGIIRYNLKSRTILRPY